MQSYFLYVAFSPYHNMYKPASIQEIYRPIWNHEGIVIRNSMSLEPMQSRMWEIFAGPNFRENPVSPSEEIFAVLIFAFSRPRPFIVAGLTEDERCPVGKGRTGCTKFTQLHVVTS